MIQRLFLFFIAISLNYFVSAQEEENKVFEKIEISASTDTKLWNQHIQRYSKLPDSIQQKIPDGTYKVVVQFVINKMGDLGSVKAKNDPGFGLSKIAEKIISSYTGRWRPANQCGREVNAYRTEQIIFTINNQQTP